MPTIREIGEEARRIDPGAFVVTIRKDTPERKTWEDRQAKALRAARKKLETES